VLVSWLEGAPRDDVHFYAQQFLEVLEQPDMVKKRCARLEVHYQIQVAVRTSLTAGNGTEHGDPMNLALARDAQDLGAASAKPLQCQHLSGHLTRVSPRILVQMDQRRCTAWR
jgi:hypothetical protein